MSKLQKLNEFVSETLKRSIHTFVFSPIGRDRVVDVRVEMSHDTARRLIAACADFAAHEGLAFESLSDVKALEDRCIVIARITFHERQAGFSWACEAVGEAPYKSTKYIDRQTGEAKDLVNDAAVRTAEARATKRAVEKLAPETIQRWLDWAERTVKASLNSVVSQCKHSPQDNFFFVEFNNACKELCISRLNAALNRKSQTAQEQHTS